MPRVFSPANYKDAFCRSLAASGIGAAETHCEEIMSECVKKVVPQAMHQDYPQRILACVTRICGSEAFLWRVEQTEPEISDETTFQNMFDSWFLDIVWPA